MPIVIATVSPLPQHRSAVRAALLAAVPQVHEEDGCELYALHENTDTFVVVEQWSTDHALAVHSRGPALTALAQTLDGRLAAPLQVVTVRPLAAGDPAKGTLGR